MEDGYVPTDGKTGHAIPIYNKSDSQLPTNYRFISLTYVFFSKCLKNSLYTDVVDVVHIFPEKQHGFIGKKSTVTNSIGCFNAWTDNYNRGILTDVIYLNYSK